MMTFVRRLQRMRNTRSLKRSRGCPPAWHLTRAVSEPHDLAHAHIKGCASCAAEFQVLQDVATRARALATDEDMRPAMRQSISARLLAGPSIAHIRASQNRAIDKLWSRPLWLGALGVAVVVIGWVTWGAMRKGMDGNRVDHVDHVDQADQADQADHVTAPAATAAVATQEPHDKSSAGFQSRASVRAVEAARFTRIAAPPDERILLQDGVIVLDVVRLGPKERFRVVTDDAEVEVRGTHFQVSASRGRLVAVRVSSGRVEVRSTRGAQATLDAGDEWVGATEDPPAPKSAQASSPTATRDPNAIDEARAAGGSSSVSVAAALTKDAPTRHVSPSAADARPNPNAKVVSETDRQRGANIASAGANRSGSPRTRAIGQSASRSVGKSFTESFDRAWSLLRSGNTRAAATAFAEVERDAAGQPLEEDASYWRAVAVARSGDAVGAKTFFGAFLRRFPASARRGEASVALGWLLLEAGQSAEARVQFERAVSDPSASIRNSATEGLSRARDK